MRAAQGKLTVEALTDTFVIRTILAILAIVSLPAGESCRGMQGQR